jgi:hypothetical protein
LLEPLAAVCVCVSVHSTVRPVVRSLCLSLRLAAASFGRKSEATKLYFIFLLLSCITDFIWMIIYGNQVPLICQRVPYICQRVPYPLHAHDSRERGLLKRSACLTPCTPVTKGLALHAHGWCTQMWFPVRGRSMVPSSVREDMSTEINTRTCAHSQTHTKIHNNRPRTSRARAHGNMHVDEHAHAREQAVHAHAHAQARAREQARVRTSVGGVCHNMEA